MFKEPIPPPLSYGTYGWTNPIVQAVNAQIASVVTVNIDAYWAITANGGDALFADALHPNDAGYRVIANEWYRLMVTWNLVN